MAQRIVARVGDDELGLSDELIGVLNTATGLDWKRDQEREVRETGKTQGGVSEIILTAAVGAVAEDVFKALLAKAREAVDVLREQWHRPPPATVEAEPEGDAATRPEPDGEAAPDPGSEA